MRLVFSRKGFDSSYGGGASPVLPDGTMISLPIPETGSGLRYSEIQTPRGPMGELMRELDITRILENRSYRPLDDCAEAHLDPDIYRGARERHADWLPAFGQCDAAQGVLRNNGVREGDLFAFYGTFRMTAETATGLTFIDQPFHAVFAYMRIGRVVTINGSTNIPWCSEHPHLVNRKRINNTLYVAADRFAASDFRAGSALLGYSQSRVLSAPGARSLWRLPRFFHPTLSGRRMTNHKMPDWTLSDDFATLQTKSPGQEYVVEATDEMERWASELLR